MGPPPYSSDLGLDVQSDLETDDHMLSSEKERKQDLESLCLCRQSDLLCHEAIDLSNAASFAFEMKQAYALSAHTLKNFRENLDALSRMSQCPGQVKDLKHWLFELMPSGHDALEIDNEVEELACAIRNFTGTVPEGGATIKLSGWDFKDQWPKILDALACNERFTKWHLSNCNIGSDAGLAVARALTKNSQVCSVHLRNNPLSGAAIEEMAKAALKCKVKFERLVLVDDFSVPLTPLVESALVQLRNKFPDVGLGCGSHGRLLESLVCMASLKNTEAQSIVRSRQRGILEAFTNGDQEGAQNMFTALKRDVVKPEHERLLKLHHGLNEKYEVIGGFEYVSMLPPDFDEYAPAQTDEHAPAQTGQWMAVALQGLSKETRVRHLLAVAEYKQPVLQSICHWVSRALQVLSLAGSAARADTKFIIPAVVDAFLVEHDLRILTSEVLAFDVSCDKIPVPPAKNHVPPSPDSTSGSPANKAENTGKMEFKDLLGLYVQSGFCNGLPCFHRAPSTSQGSNAGSYLYYNRVQGEWNISGKLNSATRWLFCPGETLPVDKDADESWFCPSTRSWVKLSFRELSSNIRLREGLVSFLERRADDQDFCKLLSLGHELLHVTMGPPKAYARAMAKEIPWLLDLNRCTLVLDSPVVMVLAFLLLKAKVEALGGRISRLTNHFLKEDEKTKLSGSLSRKMTQPPSIHLNVLLDGWTFEIMFILHDFLVAKESLHKFYELDRAESPVDILKPVFEPLFSPDDMDACISHGKLNFEDPPQVTAPQIPSTSEMGVGSTLKLDTRTPNRDSTLKLDSTQVPFTSEMGLDSPESDPEYPSGSALQAVRAKSQQ